MVLRTEIRLDRIQMGKSNCGSFWVNGRRLGLFRALMQLYCSLISVSSNEVPQNLKCLAAEGTVDGGSSEALSLVIFIHSVLTLWLLPLVVC